MAKQINIENYKRIKFSRIIDEAGNQDTNRFDIKVPHDTDMSVDDHNSIYINELVNTFVNLPTVDREAFVEYQMEKYGTDAERWLKEVSGMINDYHDDIVGFNIADDFQNIIASKLNTVPISDLQWDANDTDLLELIVALTETRSLKNVSRKHIVAVFERVFNIQLKDYDSKISKAANGRKNTVPSFTAKLAVAWEEYVKRIEAKSDKKRPTI